jgi:hypothetical protein
MNIEHILNDALNKAMCQKDRIQNPDSNKVAEFVTGYLKTEKLPIQGVGISIILKEMNKQIDKYYEDHKHCNIVTLDLSDVYTMLEKSEKKAKKRLRKK